MEERIYLSFREKHNKEAYAPQLKKDNEIMQNWRVKEEKEQHLCVCGVYTTEEFCKECNAYFEILNNDDDFFNFNKKGD